jgi:hypothetical protein
MKRVEIHWLDSLGSSGWAKMEEKVEEAVPSAMHHRSLGWVLREDEDGVLIAASMSLSESGPWKDNVADCTMIPRPSIVEMVEI